ncbi:unnamed protein product [Sphagnum balticum]
MASPFVSMIPEGVNQAIFLDTTTNKHYAIPILAWGLKSDGEVVAFVLAKDGTVPVPIDTIKNAKLIKLATGQFSKVVSELDQELAKVAK